MAIDKMKLLRGDPIVIADKITLYQPTINEIVEFGEADFFGTFWGMCSCAWDRPSVFADMGIDFMTVPDWQYFISTVRMLPKESTRLIFGDLDFTEFQLMKRTVDGKEDLVLYRESDEFIFDEALYHKVIPYVREMINFSHTGRKAADKTTAKILIMDDRKIRERNKNKEYESMLLNAVISLVNTEEFSYTYKTVMEITVYQLMKSFMQVCGKKSAMALLQGSMSGFTDTSGISADKFNWTYSEGKYKPRSNKLINNKIKKGH